MHEGLQDFLIKFENETKLESMSNAMDSWIKIRTILTVGKKAAKANS